MKAPIGTRVYFLKDYFDTPSETRVVRKEGTFYFHQNFPPNMKDQVKVGEVTRIAGQVAIPYYEYYMSFSRQEMWGSDTAPNAQRANYTPPIVTSTIADHRNRMNFETREEAMHAYKLLQDKNIECTLSGNTIGGLKNKTHAQLIIDRDKKVDLDADLFYMDLLQGKDESDDPIEI